MPTNQLGAQETVLQRALNLVAIVVGMCGLRLDRGAFQIGATSLGIALSFFLSFSLITNPEGALIYVVAVWCIYYAGHIVFFKGGLHHLMHARL